MSIRLNPDDFDNLSLHDADVLSFELLFSEEGRRDLHLNILIHPDEPVELLKAKGIDSRHICLIFEDCYRAEMNLYVTADNDVILNWGALQKSKLLSDLSSIHRPSTELYNYHIEMSSGTILDILCDSVNVKAVDEPEQ